MTTRDGFTRLLDTWLAEEGVPSTPDYLDDVLVRTSDTRQRPAWLSPGRWLPVDTTTLNPRAYSIPPVVRYGVLAALLVALLLAALALYAGTQHQRVPPPFGPASNGRIYFDVDGSIVTANLDGSERRTIDLGVPASGPLVSPDGTKVAFFSDDPSTVGGGSLWVADADGSHPRDVTGDQRLVVDPTSNPSWSPDGTQIVLGASRAGNDELFIVNTDGSGAQALGEPNVYGRANPEWSPSGQWIAFIAHPASGELEIAVIKPDGTGEHVLPTSAQAGNGFRGSQLWAPDLSNRLAYAIGSSDLSEGKAIAVMDVDTGVETIVTRGNGSEVHRPEWSPDGTRIAFRVGSSGVAVIGADGSDRTVLKDSFYNGDPITWSPDGTHLIGVRSDKELAVLDAAGVEATQFIEVDGARAGIFSWQRLAP